MFAGYDNAFLLWSGTWTQRIGIPCSISSPSPPSISGTLPLWERSTSYFTSPVFILLFISTLGFSYKINLVTCKRVCLVYFTLTLWSQGTSIFPQMTQGYESSGHSGNPPSDNVTFSPPIDLLVKVSKTTFKIRWYGFPAKSVNRLYRCNKLSLTLEKTLCLQLLLTQQTIA